MAPQDLWYKTEKEKLPDGRTITKTVPSARHGRGKRWRVNYEDPHTGKPKSPSFRTKPEAEAFEIKVKADIAAGRYHDPQAGKITVEQFGEEWRAVQFHRGRTAERVERELRKHIYPLLGRFELWQVRSQNIKNWVLNRSEVLAPSSLRMMYSSTLMPMFEQAVVDHRIPSSPCVKVRLPILDERVYTIPTTQQVYDLADALPKQFAAVPITAAGCGTRSSELFALELQDLAFLTRLLHIRQQLVKDTGRPIYLATPKTRTSKRVVEMGDPVREALARHLELYPVRPFEMDDEVNPRHIVVDEDGKRVAPRRGVHLAFPDYDGGPMTRPNWSRIWKPAVKKVGLPDGFGLRDLRHYFATALIFAGANVKTVQLAMGHATPTITLNVYTGYWPDAEDSVRGLITKALARAAA